MSHIIKAKLQYRKIRQIDIANQLRVNKSLVCNVIAGRSTSSKVLNLLSSKLNEPLEKILRWIYVESMPRLVFKKRRKIRMLK